MQIINLYILDISGVSNKDDSYTSLSLTLMSKKAEYGQFEKVEKVKNFS